MNLFSKRINDQPRRFLLIIVAVVGLIVILVIILLMQINTRKPAAPASGLSEGDLFGTALMQMGTAKVQGTPMDTSNPLILTAKAIGEETPTPNP
jgi:hypothetical protein